MKQKALILFRNENEENVINSLKSELDNEKEKERLVSDVSGYRIINIGKNYKMCELDNIWKQYKFFDDFLITLVQDFGFRDLDEKALLIGHTDKDGHLWTDYAEFSKFKHKMD
ncbi:hypothetical protein HY638_00745 [Candidatus Woesearchaeota archaeon]|nr:hypothetical protein [Candidatus Woesearchaeota archaeon]